MVCNTFTELMQERLFFPSYDINSTDNQSLSIYSENFQCLILNEFTQNLILIECLNH